MSGPDRDPAGRPLRVGISSCLLGRKVRYDGGHKLDRYLTDVLGPHCEFVPVCPELEAGMGVPREAIRLVGAADAPRLLGVRTGEDWTERLNRYAAGRVAQLEKLDLCGFVLKKDSPSCGLARVKLYDPAGGPPARSGTGLFARALRERLPLLPVEEEGRLRDAGLRDNFIVRVFARHRLQQLFAARWSRDAVVRFHAAHKYLLLAHSPAHHKQLGQLVAALKQHDPATFRARYGALFMAALKVRSTTRKNGNVLQHLVGHLREHTSAADRADILAVIEDYRQELVPLIVPITLIRHYVRRHDITYIADQVYLAPHPRELRLRNHV
ncbi:MAG: YbgA family protein [Candidatus Krumholzibacteriia bacterium]